MSGSWDRLSYLLFSCLGAVIALTVSDYGLTWDEPVQHAYGDLIYRYYASGFEDRRVLEYRDLYLYGGAFDGLVAALQRVLPGDPLQTRHWLGAGLGLLGIVASWKTARCLANPRAAFFAALLLATAPRWWGHSFNNPKDIPFAVGTIWSLYYMLRLIESLPRPSAGLLGRLALVIGLTLGVRAGGLVLFGYLALVLALYWGLGEGRGGRGAVRAGAIFAGAAIPAWLVMLVCWPWAQSGPLNRPIEALLRLSQFKPLYSNLTTLHAGRDVPVVDVPASYGLHWLAITLPEGMLALLAAGAIMALASLLRWRVALRSLATGRYALITFAAAFPLAFIAYRQSPLYDGMRQLLFVLPPLACLAGCALDAVCERASRSRWSATLRSTALAGCALYGAMHLGLMWHLHPHHTVYFNQLVGGLAGAAGRYELDYWGNSYREATGLLVARLEREARNQSPRRSAIGPYKVFLCSAPQSGSHFFPRYLSFTLDRAEADFMMATTRFGCHERLAGVPIGRVERMGTTLAVVTDRRAEAPQ